MDDKNDAWAIRELIKNNPLYMLCSLIYLVLSCLFLGGKPFSWFIGILIYLVSLFIVFSSLGESILRFVDNIRPLLTKREKDYLMPIFEEAYEEAKKHNPKLDIELCVIDQMTTNAYALGLHTIAVTKGAMETFSEDELKAVISHEIGHIANKDTMAKLFLLVGCGFFSFFILIGRFLIGLAEKLMSALTYNKIIRFIVSCARALLYFYTFFFGLLMNLLEAVNSRKNEYRADEYSYKLGFGNEMTEALYLLEKISLSNNSSIIAKMLASHPILPRRIARLEYLIDNRS